MIAAKHAGKQPGSEIQSPIPVVPVRDAVHFPSLINTLHVVREPSVRAVKRGLERDQLVLVLSQRDMAVEEPGANDLHRFGTLSEVLQATPLPDGSFRVALRGVRRIRATKIVNRAGSFWAEAEQIEEVDHEGPEVDASMRLAVESFSSIVELNKSLPPESLQSVVHVEHPGALADAIAHHLPLRSAQKQELLELVDTKERLKRTLLFLKREEQVLRLNVDISKRVERELGDSQREFYLREQLRVIQEELQLREDRLGETDQYLAKIEALNVDETVHEHLLSELRRLDRTPAASPEGMVLRNYLDTLVTLPWSKADEDRVSIKQAEAILNRGHSGLREVKERVLDHLAARKLNPVLKGPILCFVGPPGVGKTSVGRAVAEALGRKFVRISLGGIRDEAEIRGHRRTYVGSMPGRILQSLRQCGSNNPVIVLDELDKIGKDQQTDPTSALLEALDPEQNQAFSDHYIEVPFDLSGAIFIATANALEAIPGPLRDRMEVIPFSSYTEFERIRIGESHLLPRCIQEHAVQERVTVTSGVIARLASDYTREAGVRDLERMIAKVVRKGARKALETNAQVTIAPDDLPQLLGHPRFAKSNETALRPGEAHGLVVSESGGDTVRIEVAIMPKQGENPSVKLTGNLGQVMCESADTALSWLRANCGRLKLPNLSGDVHIHVPEGAIPKDGPSAGLTILLALVSCISSQSLPQDMAMTGEITLLGRVLPVGGIRDKLLAAKKAGLNRILLSRENIIDVEDLDGEVAEGLELCFVSTADDALHLALGL